MITAYLLVLALIAAGVLAAAPHSPWVTRSTSATLGGALFAVLSLFLLLLLLFVTPASTAPAISGERQRQTLDLLLVTRLSTPGIILGKLFAALSFDILLLICALPLFSIVFLFGGVAPEQVAAAYALFLATVVVLGSASLCISTLTSRSQASSALSSLFAFGLVVGLAVITAFLAASRGATPSNAPPPPPQLPFPAYLDPLFGLLYLMPPLAPGGFAGGLGTPVPGPFGLPLELWHYNVIAALGLSCLFVGISMARLRPTTRPRRARGRAG
ncbi:MAG: hypothetical protein NVSMB65_20270 [Chloroflexota bacterium]